MEDELLIKIINKRIEPMDIFLDKHMNSPKCVDENEKLS
jgi:hypothetical protein